MTNIIKISKSLQNDLNEYNQTNTKIRHLNQCKFTISQIHKILQISYQHSNNTIKNPTKNPRERVNKEKVNNYLNK